MVAPARLILPASSRSHAFQHRSISWRVRSCVHLIGLNRGVDGNGHLLAQRNDGWVAHRSISEGLRAGPPGNQGYDDRVLNAELAFQPRCAGGLEPLGLVV